MPSHPEFEGGLIRDFYEARRLLGDRQAIRDLVTAVAARPGYGPDRPELAEMAKYADNAWHALKVTFANEIGSLAKAQGGRVMDSSAPTPRTCPRSTHAPVSAAPAFPGCATRAARICRCSTRSCRATLNSSSGPSRCADAGSPGRCWDSPKRHRRPAHGRWWSSVGKI